MRVVQFNLMQGYVFSSIAAALPAYLARRRHNKINNGDLSSVVQGFFSLGIGMSVMIFHLMEVGNLVALEDEPMSANRLHEITEDSGALIVRDKCCAGSPSVIKGWLDILMNGNYRSQEISPEVQKEFDNIGDMSNFYDYLYSSSRLELYAKLNQFIYARLLTIFTNERKAAI